MEQLLQLLKSNPPATTVGSLAQLGLEHGEDDWQC
ncbi:hypothetical protein CK203_045765 [Vitis vinifera]|uniref:Uncharacterized protein n=1 Tax=Vitis vinifera TaxID=29760 RepID=A0A438I169_VITVI|nr:hypothetical protein CK203_045765 [Vitis vinifera]